jgi:Tannase and feruloyl esterase
MMKRPFLLGFLVFCTAAPALGQITNRMSIVNLRQLRLPDVAIESATPVTPDGQKMLLGAGYVDLKGVIGGHIRFELLLPDAWNGRFVMGGGGGFVGTVQGVSRDAVNRGYASAGTDTGHEWQPNYMAGWALDNLEAQLNFGYLAVHRTAEVAKALIRAYYGRIPPIPISPVAPGAAVKP